jgi:DNA-binding transcriptional regulator YiaG
MKVLSTRLPPPDRIVRARREAALTQEELARTIGVSLASVGKWERGSRSPTGRRLRDLALATGKPIAWFFQEEAAA